MKSFALSVLLLTILFIPLAAQAQYLEYVGSTPLSEANDIKIAGNYAYIVTGYSGLQVFDLTNPENPAFIRSFSEIVNALYEFKLGNYLYVSDIPHDAHAWIKVIDITDPANPVYVGSTEDMVWAWSIAAYGNYAYAATGTCGLRILDINEPNNPFPIGWWESNLYTIDRSEGICISGQLAYVANFEVGFEILDLENPVDPEIVSYLWHAGTSSVFLNGNYAYVGSGFHLQIIDISNPLIPTVISTIPTHGVAKDIKFIGNYAFAAVGRGGGNVDDDNGLLLLDISNPTNPVLVDSLTTLGCSYSIALLGDYAYVADGSSLIILRINLTGIGDEHRGPESFSLSPNYPNPFNAQTTISYSLPQTGPVNIAIYNLIGQKMAVLLNGIEQAGKHKIIWNAKDYPSGIYFARLETSAQSENIKMVLLK